MTTTTERTKATAGLIRVAGKITREVSREPLRAKLLELERDIYAETIAATGIDPGTPMP